MALVYLGLGSNIGDRQKNIEQAISFLKSRVVVEKVSTLIETDPIGGPPQGRYLNAVLKVMATVSPKKLLKVTQEIEQRMGRLRTSVKNAPRIIDIDILLYDDLKLNDTELTIPHPRMLTRPFVMGPLNELAPDLVAALHEECV